jgi:long-chain fatty acid transport protein
MVTPGARCVGLAVALTALSAAGPAQALEGYFQHGYGVRASALAGAGVADGRDATTTVLNPAGLVNAKDEADLAIGVFSPTREFDGSGTPGLTPTGSVDSSKLYFLVPNSAFSYHLDPNPYIDVVGLSFYGNGADTSYPDFIRTDCLNGGSGMYCDGKAGVDLQQYFMTVAAAKTIAPGLSVGIGPIIGLQMFEAHGLALFANIPDSPDTAWGIGARGGIQWSVTRDFRVGAQISTPVYMAAFSKYAPLLAGRGDCDVPANGQAGIAYDANRDVTLMLDYQRINYGSIKCVANPADGIGFGTDTGPGFGWHDINAFKLGLEWRNATPGLTLRGGYSYNTRLFGSHDVQLDILAPAASQNHLTAGGEYVINRDWSAEVSGLYAPQSTVNGAELGPTSGHLIDVSTTQWQVLVGLKYLYDRDLLSR